MGGSRQNGILRDSVRRLLRLFFSLERSHLYNCVYEFMTRCYRRDVALRRAEARVDGREAAPTSSSSVAAQHSRSGVSAPKHDVRDTSP